MDQQKAESVVTGENYELREKRETGNPHPAIGMPLRTESSGLAFNR
jgi:hypothetical protein